MDQLIEFTNNNLLLVAASIGLFLAAIFNELKIKEGDICGLSTIDAVKLINKNSIIIDLRTPNAFEDKHVLNSINMAQDDLTEGFINKHKNSLLFICETGGQSKKTSLLYRKKGAKNVFYIKGGLIEWTKNSLPLSN
tara:strand:+ start:107 stop:517 length:411 start_codon:yes stop_codon:yes gene_type:complete